MSMKTTDEVVKRSATFFATVDLPDPDPPAIPIISGFVIPVQNYNSRAWNALCPLVQLRTTGNPMKMRSMVLAMMIVGGIGCNALRKEPDLSNQTERTVLEVDNRGFIDMTVYVLRSSQRIRLGTAPGNRKTSLDLPAGLMAGMTTLRFVADPIGGSRASVSEEITVTPGDTIGLLIPPL
jgi:hypothetical protein